ncbi:N-formylglutamate amidohydrolase [Algimonas ampicilliniresistens]|uniref:N-formylglutamate amidohydrolase n=1 Tax=Algimonas ampicilliniresistens TaxID=1298735 RepID=A0ABQ5V5E8_9PROT|nr:N-formylglutamate amidohydrolase [Algimonas ampicilliniresistens]GLQ22317.1 N-formylglutamate amidohydrolase [Algimonas ampicilliniresistens]
MSPFFHIDGPSSDAFVFADHASNAVPEWVGDLGLSEAEMTRHIAWDIGTDWVARALCEHLNCSGLICGFSRLVIDANRSPDAPGLIPLVSDHTEIPGNHGLSEPQRDERIVRLYQAYHDTLGDALDDRPDCLALSIHSFTPQLRDQPKRTTDIGLLVKDDSETPIGFIRQMTAIASEFQVDINEPYSAHDLNHTVDHNVVPRGHPHLAIELRQDHIGTKSDAERMAERLALAIRPLIKEI